MKRMRLVAWIVYTSSVPDAYTHPELRGTSFEIPRVLFRRLVRFG